MTLALPAHRRDVIGWIDNVLDLRGQCFERVPFLGMVRVSIINAAYAADDGV